MADLLRVQAVLQVFKGQTSVPTDPFQPEVNEEFEAQINLGDFAGPMKQKIVAGANNVSLTVPSPPYDAVLYFETNTPVEINVNGQGYQRVESAYLSMAIVISVLVRNIIIPPGATATVDATVRWFLAKREP